VIALTCTELATATGGRLSVPSAGAVTVDGVTADSRLVPDGRPLFVALATDSGDGHDHARDAVAAGAVAVLAMRPLDVDVPVILVADTWTALRRLATHVRTRLGPITVAITGSVGKTTVKDLTAAAVGAGRRTHAARGSYNNELGVPLTVLGMPADVEVLVAEIGARRRGNIAELAPVVAPDIAVVTAVAPAHLGVFGSIEAIAAAKAELVEALGPQGVAVLHLADERVAAMAERAPRVVTVATDRADADVHARGVVLDRRARARGTAVTPWGEVAFALPIAGRHHVVNALFALAVAGELGVDLTAAAAAISTAAVSPWRAAILELGGVTVLDDAYNASPTAVTAALETLVAIEGRGRRIAVLGRMAELGPGAATAHRELGARCAGFGVDHLVVVGDRSDPDAEVAPLAVGARDAGVPEVTEVADATEAATLVTGMVRPGDVVLVKASRVVGLEGVVAALAAAGTTSDREGRA